MIQVRPAAERGHFDHGWLDTHHTFSFAHYRDPAYPGFRALQVINEDRVQPGAGFDTHEHWDMEILTMVLEGALEHRDSLGNGSVIHPGEFQRMTAGAGIRHSEFNPSTSEPCHFLQIWILPDHKSLGPAYEQRAFPAEERRNVLRTVASRDGRNDSLTIHQDVQVFTSLLDPGKEVHGNIAADRHGWLQVTSGQVKLNDVPLGPGDGAAISEESSLLIIADKPSEVLLFDLA